MLYVVVMADIENDSDARVNHGDGDGDDDGDGDSHGDIGDGRWCYWR